MAIVTLRIPDDTLELYKKMSPLNPSAALEGQLERMKGVPYHDRAVVFPSEVRRDLEVLYGTPIENPEKFVKWVKGLMTASIEGLEFTLRAGQRKRLEGQANFFKKPFLEFVKAKVGAILDRELGNN